VFALEPGPTGTRARLRPIVVGRISGTELRVRSGLLPGARIVAEGAVFLQDQQTVRVLE